MLHIREPGLSSPGNSCFLCVGEKIEPAPGFQEEENDYCGREDAFRRDAEEQPLAGAKASLRRLAFLRVN